MTSPAPWRLFAVGTIPWGAEGVVGTASVAHSHGGVLRQDVWLEKDSDLWYVESLLTVSTADRDVSPQIAQYGFMFSIDWMPDRTMILGSGGADFSIRDDEGDDALLTSEGLVVLTGPSGAAVDLSIDSARYRCTVPADRLQLVAVPYWRAQQGNATYTLLNRPAY